MSNQEKLKSGGETKVFKAETLEVDYAQGLGSSGNRKRDLFASKDKLKEKNEDTSSNKDTSVGKIYASAVLHNNMSLIF